MPKVTVYVRKADIAKWKSVKKKTEFLSNALSSLSLEPDVFLLSPKVAKEQGVELCKIHGLPLDDRGRCLQKGCKYS